MRSIQGTGRRTVGLAAFALLVSCTGSTATAPIGSGSSSAVAPALVWSLDLHHALTAPTVSQGLVYVADRDSLIALPIDCGDPCEPAWEAKLPAGMAATGWDTDYTGTADDYHAPVVAGGHVYVATDHPAGVASFPARCDRATCEAEWFGRVAHAASDPAVAHGAVFVGSGAGRLYAFPTSCEAQCAPSAVVALPGTFEHPGRSAPVARAGDMIVVSSADRVYAVDPRTRELAWWGGPGPGGANGEGASATAYIGGMVYATLWGIDPNVPRLYAYGVHCRADGRECPPTWSAGTKDDFLGRPQLGAGAIYVGTETSPGSGDGSLYEYPAACAASGGCASWSTHVPSELVVGWFAVHDGVLYAVSREQGDAYAFPVRCDDNCQPLWTTGTLSTEVGGTDETTSTGPYEPAFVGDKVLFATTGGVIRVFDPATCGSGGSVCDAVGSWDASIGHLTNVAVDGDVAYVASDSGAIVAFRP